MAPSVRRPRTQPQRTLHYNARAGVLYLHVHRSGEVETGYFVDEVKCEIGGRGFEVTKILDRQTYHVHVIPGKGATCDCKGHTRHGHCKHAAALAHLIDAGKL